jgi:DNA-binding transcriptional LysR family regulator
MGSPKASLDQWQCFLAVVDEGSYARAAEHLHKSQSAVSYAIQKLEQQLGIRVFAIRGRKAELTPVGRQLYQRGRALLNEALRLEEAARAAAAGWEAELRMVVDTLFPQDALLDTLAAMAETCPATRVECLETVLSGAEEALLERRCDLAITGVVPAGFMGDLLLRVRFVAVALRDHPLLKLNRALSFQDLRQHRQLVVRDSGQRRRRDSGWLEAPQRLTVSRMDLSARAVARGLGFAWLPDLAIRRELASGLLQPLPLAEGGERFVDLYLIFPNRDLAGSAARQCESLLREKLAKHVCSPFLAGNGAAGT